MLSLLAMVHGKVDKVILSSSHIAQHQPLSNSGSVRFQLLNTVKSILSPLVDFRGFPGTAVSADGFEKHFEIANLNPEAKSIILVVGDEYLDVAPQRLMQFASFNGISPNKFQLLVIKRNLSVSQFEQ